MSNRLVVELKEDFLPKIRRRKNEFIKMLGKALEKGEKLDELSTRFGVVIIHSGDGHEKLVLNIDGEPVFRR